MKRHNGVEAKLGRDQAKAQWGIAFSTEKKQGEFLGQVTVELFDFYVLPKSQYMVTIIDNDSLSRMQSPSFLSEWVIITITTIIVIIITITIIIVIIITIIVIIVIIITQAEAFKVAVAIYFLFDQRRDPDLEAGAAAKFEKLNVNEIKTICSNKFIAFKLC